MSKVLSAALLGALVALAGPALASQFNTSGTIAAVHSRDNVVVLRNGDAYQLPSNTDAATLRPGERVTISWNEQATQTYLRLSTDSKTMWLIKAQSLQRSE
jgi:hypothetical protein